MNRTARREFLSKQIDEQRKWIEQCGGSLSGYVERYGKPTDANCYGNGGFAIYAADMNELRRLETLAERYA